MKYFLGILLLMVSAAAFAQPSKKDKALVQFSGVVHNADSTQIIVPYVTITNVTQQKQVSASDYQGYFSFVVHEQDTLRFTSVGYAPQIVVVPSNLPHKSLTMPVNLKAQIINLPAVRVFPWATTDEFKKDFLTMKLADDDLEIARKNVSRSTIAYMMNHLPRDGAEIQSFNAQQMHTDIENSHSITNPLLNPIAWGTLINQISEGDKSRANGN